MWYVIRLARTNIEKGAGLTKEFPKRGVAVQVVHHNNCIWKFLWRLLRDEKGQGGIDNAPRGLMGFEGARPAEARRKASAGGRVFERASRPSSSRQWSAPGQHVDPDRQERRPPKEKSFKIERFFATRYLNAITILAFGRKCQGGTARTEVEML